MKLTTASSDVLFEREAVIERKRLNLDVPPDARKQHAELQITTRPPGPIGLVVKTTIERETTKTSWSKIRIKREAWPEHVSADLRSKLLSP